MKTAKNTMNLVLQGLDDCEVRLERIAALTAPIRLTWLSKTALRCEGITYSQALHQTIEVAAQAADRPDAHH